MAEINLTHQYNGGEERSDTLRSDQESDAEGQGGISSNLKGSRPKRSAFQITSVEPKGKDNNHGAEDADSQDELEESRIDDASSSELLDVSNLSKGSQNSDADKSLLDESISKSTVSLPDRTDSTTVPIESLNTDETASNDGTADTNGNGPSRFRVVKVPNPEPVKRGRWTCKDFPSEANQGQVVQEKSDIGKESIHSGDSSAASSVHYVPGEATDTFTDEVKSRSKRPPSRQTSSRKTSVLDSIMKDMKLTATEDDDSAATGGPGAIDNKIEQAMDIVKGHLLMAVREEVEVLKEQINDLLNTNEQLRKENIMLREEKSSSRPHSQMQLNMGTGPSSTQETQYQGIQPNPSTHTSSTYHQHSLQGQPSISSSTSTGAPPPTEHYPPPAGHHHHPAAQEQPPFMPGEEQATSYPANTSQPPSTVTTNSALTEQYQHQQPTGAGQSIVHASQDGQYTTMSQQQSPQTVEPHTSGALNQSQAHPSSGMEQQGLYQPPTPVNHHLGASAQPEHSQPVPPPTTGAIPSHSQGEPQKGHL